MKPYLILDIETGPLPEAHQRLIMPSEWPTGNTKDPEKLKVAIAEKEVSWFESATLEATRCEVLAIGIKNEMDENLTHGGTEKERLNHILHLVEFVYGGDMVVGHRLLAFDIPILVRRMWANGIKPPQKWLNCSPY